MSPVTEAGFRTHDLALATTLSMRGMTFSLQNNGRGRAWFVFAPVTSHEVEDLERTVQRFSSGQERVDPLQFMKEVKKVREALYRFLDDGV